MKRKTMAVVALVLAALLAPGMLSENQPDEIASPQAVKAVQRSPVGTAGIRLLGVNDFHGNLESPDEVDGRPVGGAAHVATYLDRYEGGGNTIRVHAGDMVGRLRSRRATFTASRPTRR